ncbi:MAG: alpha/beta hydrolase family protein, partial [Anaerolineae bacterium]
MTVRNLSPNQMFVEMAKAHTPQYRFSSKTSKDFAAWKAEALPKVLATLGDYPPAVDPNPQLLAEWREEGLIRQRWIIDVQPYLSATLRVNIPEDVVEGERRPAILCCHGHGQFGKEPVMGNRTSPVLRQSIEDHNCNYGEIMAQKGFVTYAIDWIGFGER